MKQPTTVRQLLSVSGSCMKNDHCDTIDTTTVPYTPVNCTVWLWLLHHHNVVLGWWHTDWAGHYYTNLSVCAYRTLVYRRYRYDLFCYEVISMGYEVFCGHVFSVWPLFSAEDLRNTKHLFPSNNNDIKIMNEEESSHTSSCCVSVLSAGCL